MGMSRELKVGIAGGVVSSLVVIYLFQPILDASIYMIKGLAYVTGKAYYDRIFIQAAILEERNFGFFITVSILFLLSYAFVYGSYKAVRRSFGSTPKERPEVPLKIRKVMSVLALFLTVSLLISTALVVSANQLQLELITSFKQYMRIIKPYIDPSKEAALISRWSQMKGRSDYLQVMEEIEETARKNKIILPKNTLYTIDTL